MESNEGVRDLSEKDAHREFVDSLRELANWYEARPELKLPTLTRFDVFPKKEELEKVTRLFGSCTKDYGTSFFNLSKKFGKTLTLEASWYREEVCERVKVGEEEVDEPIVVTQGYKKVVREKFEWRCPGILGGEHATK